jgi:hypothetical protein
MNLPKLPIRPTSPKECVDLYLQRLPANVFRWPHTSLLLTAYMAWPNARVGFDGFIAAFLAKFFQKFGKVTVVDESAKETSAEQSALERFGGVGAIAGPALDYLLGEITQMQPKWLWVADIFQMTVDMAHDDRIELRGGSSISKAIELCELESGLPGHSQLRRAWSDFRDVAHLLAASTHLAHKGLAYSPTEREASILKAIWTAPDAVLALAAGFQEFGLQPNAVRKKSSILRPDNVWRVPDDTKPEKPFVVRRRLTEAQLDFLSTRRARKEYIAIDAHTP